MISFGGSIGANPYQDRPGIHCRTVKDAATVLDAFRDTKTGSYFDARDPYTALPRVIASKTPYVSALSDRRQSEAAGRHAHRRDSRVDGQAHAERCRGQRRHQSELKVLQDLGAELVETIDPQYPDDPSIPNMAFTFKDAIAEILPFHMPEVFSWKKRRQAGIRSAGLRRDQPQVPGQPPRHTRRPGRPT